MKWLRENECPWNNWTFTSAALQGNLENLEWWNENNLQGFEFKDSVKESQSKIQEYRLQLKFKYSIFPLCIQIHSITK